ncbi:MAG TPA: hypothetical protein DCQ98_20300, partial [Planctomycetaceae bacterium]|nr:hypothetical protein [Planctomycetaceae bacterium]
FRRVRRPGDAFPAGRLTPLAKSLAAADQVRQGSAAVSRSWQKIGGLGEIAVVARRTNVAQSRFRSIDR